MYMYSISATVIAMRGRGMVVSSVLRDISMWTDTHRPPLFGLISDFDHANI